ncbi:hypothetical protein [Novosphingobium sp. 9]|uniref:hypothetical protein n=1 Tax=Novosphingobium sp. 9 TaxID=2025349 RepID=UPI0021B4ED9D|nr:hypothetical protein [Novosphingobium sp. 9]
MDRHAIVRLRSLCALALSFAALSATPALAKAVAPESAPAPAPAPIQFSFDPAARAAWLDDCHRRLGYRDGAAGYDSGECEAYLDSYAARYEAAARGEPGYVYGYAPGMVPVMMVPVAPSGAQSTPAPVQQPTAASPAAAHSSPVIDYAYVDTGSRLSPGSKAPLRR